MVASLSELSNPQLAQLFNALTGQAVSRFTDRKVGVARVAKVLNATGTNLWDALEMAGLVEADAPQEPVVDASVPDVPATDPEQPTNADGGPEFKRDKYGFVRRVRAPKEDKPKRAGRLETVLALLRRDGGATVEEICEATGWLPHTTRAYLSKGGAGGRAVTIISKRVTKANGAERAYTVYSAR